jgi:hypothetical protein
MEVKYYWATFEDGTKACVEATTKKRAEKRAAKHLPVESVKRLTYPAEPRLNILRGQEDICPSMCIRPNECAGNGCINPNNRSCSS